MNSLPSASLLGPWRPQAYVKLASRHLAEFHQSILAGVLRDLDFFKSWDPSLRPELAVDPKHPNYVTLTWPEGSSVSDGTIKYACGVVAGTLSWKNFEVV